jgi:hypothetical protein
MSRAVLRLKRKPAADELAPPLRPRKPLLTPPAVAVESAAAIAASAPHSPTALSRPAAQRLTEYAVLLTAAVAVILGYAFRHSDVFVPYEGAGYYLGIAGGVGMLLQLFYAYAKKLRVFHSVAASRAVFHLHMILGLAGPILILYHCKFSWGAKNSNVALIAMFLVVGSGLAGRIVHRKIRAGLHGQGRDTGSAKPRAQHLREIMDADIGGTGWLVAERLSALSAAVPDGKTSPMPLWAALTAPFRIGLARLALARLIRAAVTQNAAQHGWSAGEQSRYCGLANQHVADFLSANYAIPQLLVWERLLSFWHLLHVPLFYFLVLAGITHVVAVHWY